MVREQPRDDVRGQVQRVGAERRAIEGADGVEAGGKAGERGQGRVGETGAEKESGLTQATDCPFRSEYCRSSLPETFRVNRAMTWDGRTPRSRCWEQTEPRLVDAVSSADLDRSAPPLRALLLARLNGGGSYSRAIEVERSDSTPELAPACHCLNVAIPLQRVCGDA